MIERDIELEYIINSLCEKRPKLPIRILLKVSIYCIKYLQKAPYAVTDGAVELCKKLGKSGMSGFLNAILRKYIKNPNILLPKDDLSALSIKYSFPEFAVRELIRDYGIEQTKNILAYDEVVTYLRFADGINGEEYLSNLNKNFSKTVFDNCFALKNFTRENGFFEGKYTFQSIGSVAICDLVEGGNSLIDVCAAPGGKTVALANKFNRVVACEIHEHRAELIKEYVKRMNVSNVEVFVRDSTLFNVEFENLFDAVLCDSPCSGFGVAKENPDIKINREYQNLNELTQIQLKILSNVSRYLKTGGFLYYSTCSIFKKENDDVIAMFLKNNKNFKVVELNSKLSHQKTPFGLQFLPNISQGAGFFISKLQKL